MFGGETLSDLYYEQWIPANEMVPDGTSGPTAGTRQETTLKAAHYDYIEFADSATTMAHAQVVIPADFDATAGESIAVVMWETDTVVTSESAHWDVSWTGVGDGEDLNKTYTDGERLHDDAKGTTRYLSIHLLPAFDPMSMAAGDIGYLKISRINDGDDDLTDVARVLAIGWQYKALGSSNAQWS
jgi:hypothetical protein